MRSDHIFTNKLLTSKLPYSNSHCSQAQENKQCNYTNVFKADNVSTKVLIVDCYSDLEAQAMSSERGIDPVMAVTTDSSRGQN